MPVLLLSWYVKVYYPWDLLKPTTFWTGPGKMSSWTGPMCGWARSKIYGPCRPVVCRAETHAGLYYRSILMVYKCSLQEVDQKILLVPLVECTSWSIKVRIDKHLLLSSADRSAYLYQNETLSLHILMQDFILFYFFLNV